MASALMSIGYGRCCRRSKIYATQFNFLSAEDPYDVLLVLQQCLVGTARLIDTQTNFSKVDSEKFQRRGHAHADEEGAGYRAEGEGYRGKGVWDRGRGWRVEGRG